MKDTTFWPSAKQVKRLAKSYKPAQGKTGLEETLVTQLRYPLSDRVHRFPMPAGGLFSTASDTAQFCRMILNGGVCEGKRLLSKEAVRQLTSRQTAPDIKDSYGLGFAVGTDWCGHGGAYATNMQIDRRRGLVLVWMVQHNGFPVQCLCMLSQRGRIRQRRIPSSARTSIKMGVVKVSRILTAAR